MGRFLNAAIAAVLALILGAVGELVGHDAPIAGASLVFLAGVSAALAFALYERHPYADGETP